MSRTVPILMASTQDLDRHVQSSAQNNDTTCTDKDGRNNRPFEKR
jgi:hypothetical protein